MTREEAGALILRRRKQCIVHRICYYVYDYNVIPDHQYDKWENELRDLVNQYPDIAAVIEYDEICPSRCVGSDKEENYPPMLVRTAQMLIDYDKRQKAEQITGARPKAKAVQRVDPKQGSLFSLMGKGAGK